MHTPEPPNGKYAPVLGPSSTPTNPAGSTPLSPESPRRNELETWPSPLSEGYLKNPENDQVAKFLDELLARLLEEKSFVPSEIRRDLDAFRSKSLFLKSLETLLRHEVLDKYLRSSVEVRKLLYHLLGDRYPDHFARLANPSPNSFDDSNDETRIQELAKSQAEIMYIDYIYANNDGKSTYIIRGLSQNESWEVELEVEIKEPLGEPPIDNQRVTDDEPAPGISGPVKRLQPTPLRRRLISTLDDFELGPYKGWRTEPPSVMLARALHFLADEDVERTVSWQDKIAELTEYCAHLLNIYKGEDWGPDLHEALAMLRTHEVCDRYHHAKTKLSLEFPNMWPADSIRLPQIEGYSSGSDSFRAEPRMHHENRHVRFLLQPLPTGYDEPHTVSPQVYERFYVKSFLADARKNWIRQHAVQGERPTTTNFAHHEEDHYEKCMQAGSKFTQSELGRNHSGTWYGPKSVVKSRTGTEGIRRSSGLLYAQFRASRRAGLQQCLNAFGDGLSELPETTQIPLLVPKPIAPVKDVSFTLPRQKLSTPPKKEARDPWSYSRALKLYKKTDLGLARLVKGHAIKECQRHQRWLRRERPIHALPLNWKGPVSPNIWDLPMQEALVKLREYNELADEIWKFGRWAERSFIQDFTRTVSLGMKTEKSLDLKTVEGNQIRLTDKDYSSAEKTSLAPIRPDEVELLRTLCQPSRRPYTYAPPNKPLGPRGRLLFARVWEMLCDNRNDAFFKGTQPRPFARFMERLNESCDGPVKKYKFSKRDVEDNLEALDSFNLITFEVTPEGDKVGRYEATIHPEQVVLWGQSLEKYNQAHENVSKKKKQGVAIDDASSDGMSVASLSLEEHGDSGKLPVPQLIIIHNPKKGRKQTLLNHEDLAEVYGIFARLAYRFGATIRDLEEQIQEGERWLTAQTSDKRKEEALFLDDSIEFWLDDASKLPNKGRERHDRLTPRYVDIVRTVDPDNYKPEWKDETRHDPEDACLELVRQNVLREAYENKTMLWPKSFKVGEKVGRDLLSKRVQLREPIWTFGHPSNRREAPRFFDINRWPVHLQSKENQEKIKLSGPNEDSGTNEVESVGSESDVEVEDVEVEEPEIDDEVVVTFAESERMGRVHKGPAQFWGGDTPYQRELIINRLRGCLETRVPEPRWRRYLRFWPFSQNEKYWNPEPATKLTLPPLAKKFIPKSTPNPSNDIVEIMEPRVRRPRKERPRDRGNQSEDEDDGSDLEEVPSSDWDDPITLNAPIREASNPGPEGRTRISAPTPKPTPRPRSPLKGILKKPNQGQRENIVSVRSVGSSGPPGQPGEYRLTRKRVLIQAPGESDPRKRQRLDEDEADTEPNEGLNESTRQKEEVQLAEYGGRQRHGMYPKEFVEYDL